MATGFLTTHVLDTARGVPAAGLVISLFGVHDNSHQLITSMTTNADGRTDSPILPAGAFQDLPEPKFLSDIPIDFAIADAASHYHVPLLLSPFGYSTYRGS